MGLFLPMSTNTKENKTLFLSSAYSLVVLGVVCKRTDSDNIL